MSSDGEYSNEDDRSESSIIMPPLRFLKLAEYLDLIRDAAFTPAPFWVGNAPPMTMVIGNPSSDLDSFISSVSLAYFLNSGVRGAFPMYRVRKALPKEHCSRRLYISLLNMPKTDSQDDLQRIRPEFGVALRWAFRVGNNDKRDVKDAIENPDDMEKGLCSSLLTTFDLTKEKQTFGQFESYFRPDSVSARSISASEKQPLILVDHNAPSMPPLSSEHISKVFTITGCIDHHVEEDVVPKSASVKPRIIQTGIGSCMTLVVLHLRTSGIWPDLTKHTHNNRAKMYTANANNQSSELDRMDIAGLKQISTLALAPILVDTSNLKASGEKCSELDKQVVDFLESQIRFSSPELQELDYDYSRDRFYSELSKAKTNSLDSLTMPEILERDYKQWSSDKSQDLHLGISSIVKPISWMLKHTCNSEASRFTSSILDFSSEADRRLGIFVFSTRGVKDKAKELGAVAFNEAGIQVIDAFEQKATGELGLGPWEGDDTDEALRNEMDNTFGKKNMKWRLWWMKDVEKTRKQIAPLVREAISAVEDG
jgi:exopolyphosphatase